MADAQQQPALLNPAQVLGGQQQQPQQNGGQFGFLKSLVVRALLIYFVTSYFRKSPAPATTTGPDGKVVPGGSRSFGNLYVNGTVFDLYAYVSEDKLRPNFDHPGELVWMQPELVYGDWTSGEFGDGSYVHKARVPLSRQVQQNGSLWLHTYFVPTKASPNSKSKDFDGTYTVHRIKQLNKYKKRSYKKTHNLLTGETAASAEEQEKANSNIQQEILSHWHPNLTINIIDDHSPWVRGQVPGPLQDFVQFELTTGKYYPIVYMNDYWNLIRDYQPINETVKEIELRLTFQPMSLLKWQLYTAQAMRTKWSTMLGTDLMEQDEEEQDVLKETMLETSVVLLALTIVVSITHSVFEFLAFKNDIQFWRNRRSLEGLSVRSVFFNVFQSTVVMLYVWDNDTNFMIKISVAIGLVIELWKIKQVVNIERVQGETWLGGLVPKVRITDKGSYVESSTREYDNLAFKYLSWVLFPLFVGYAIYSLIYNEHKGWYSFVLNMVYGFLLTFGFIMMTPQLFINYKLKSVAHLPWRMLTYKFLNTFIDDIFAFVIKMPTLYRLGCFRDDIIFLIFAYQRWIYRVDHSRVNEFGVSGDDLAEAEQRRRQQQSGEVVADSEPITAGEQADVNEQESKKDK